MASAAVRNDSLSDTYSPVFAAGLTGRYEDPRSWSARISDTFTPLEANAVDGHLFYGALRRVDRGALMITHIAGSAQRVIRGPRQLSLADDRTVYLNVQLTGHGRLHNCMGVTRTAAGAAAIAVSEEAFELSFDAPFSQLCIAMPAAWFIAHLGIPARALDRRFIRMGSGIGAVARASIDALLDANTALEQDICADLFARALHGALRVPMPSVAPGRRAALLTAIHSLIEARYADPQLTPPVAATLLGCSLSTLHLHCQRTGRSFNTMLWAKRLSAAAAALRGAPDVYGRIDHIALACGFEDRSHFSRRFKRHFGVSPRDYR